MRPRITLPLLMGACLVLTACSGLPTSGTPQAFDIDAPTPSAVDFVAGAPTKGSSPEALVEGFLRACSAGTSDDFATARLFLSSQAAKTWDPSAAIHVYATDATALLNTVESDGTVFVQVSTPTIAEVDANGILVESSAEKENDATYALIQENGEWRIATPPEGIVLSQAAFSATYQRAQLFFPLHLDDTLVFEPRWYPQKNLSKHLLAALHEGPTGFLRDVAYTALPSEDISFDAQVDAYSGEARVNISGTFTTDMRIRDMVARQIIHTLRQSAQVSAVKIFINGEEMPLEESQEPPRLVLDVAIASKDRTIGTVVNGEFSPLPAHSGVATNTTDPQVVGNELWESLPTPAGDAELAISPVDNTVVAWVDSGVMTVVDRNRRSHTSVAHVVGSLSVDRFGWAWGLSEGNIIELAHPNAGQHFSLSGAISELSGFRVAPDGVRIALMRREEQGKSVWLGTIIRNEDGVPIQVRNVVPVARLGAEILDISWGSSDSLVAIQGLDSLHRRVVTVPVGGFAESILAPTGAERVSAGASSSLVYVTDNHQQVWARSNALWQPLDSALRRVRFPG